MGCCLSFQEFIIKDPKSFRKSFRSYESIKNMIKYIKNNPKMTKEVYLIDVNTIPDFIKRINESEVLDNLNLDNTQNNKKEEECERKLKEFLNDYIREENIKIYDSYQDCANLARDNNTEKNKIIIVDELFIENMINNDDERKYNKFVNLIVDKKKVKIQFNASGYFINLEEISTGIYKFLEDTPVQVQDNHQNFNPKSSNYK